MAKEKKPLVGNTAKQTEAQFKNRIQEMYASPDELPASISIRQAEALMERVKHLETQLEHQGPAPQPAARPAQGSSDQAQPAPDVDAVLPSIPASVLASLPVRPARFPRLASLWARLTGAHPGILDAGERQQAQLSAAIALGLATLTLTGFLAGLAVGAEPTNSVVLLAMTILIALTYAATRSRSYKLGSAMLVLIFVAAGFGLATTEPGRESNAFYSMLPIALIMGSLLLPLWGLGVLTGMTFLAVLAAPTFLTTYPFSEATTDGGIMLTLGALLTIAVAFRNSVERSRVAEVTTVNRELQAVQSSLELRVADRTHDLELAAEVGRTVTERMAEPQEMLTSAAEMIRARFELYYTQVYLTDSLERNLVLRAGTGEVGQELLKRSHSLPLTPGSLNGRAAIDRKPVIVADTLQSPTFLPNPLLPGTRSEMAIPLIAGGRVIGVLDMQSEIPGALNEGNLPAFQVLAGQLSVAIQNASLFAQTEEARKEVEASAGRVTSAGWQDFLNSIERGEKLGFLYDQGETLPVKDFSQAQGAGLSVPITITGAEIGRLQMQDEQRQWTDQDQQIAALTAAQLGQHIEGLRLLAQTERYRSEAEQAVRQLTRQGWGDYLKTRQELGPGFIYDRNEVRRLEKSSQGSTNGSQKRTLIVRDAPIGELEVDIETHSAEVDELLTAVAAQLSGHIENLRLSEQNEKRAHELEVVAELSATTSTVLDPERLLQTIVDNTRDRFNLYHAHIYLADEAWISLLLTAGAGEVGRKMVAAQHAIPLDAEQSLVARSARERRAVIVNDVRSDPTFLPNPDLPETRAEMAVPMIVGDQVLGVFDVQSNQVSGFSDEDASIYTTLASQVAVALQNARLYVAQAATVTQLRELDRLKSSFLANMSHELRTPLNSILGFSDVMLEELDGPLTETMSNDLKLIQKNGQHLLALINDVLDMAKIEAGRMNLSPEKFYVHEVMDEVVGLTSTLASSKNLALNIEEASDSDIQIFADRTRIRQVMINLVNNSIKFTEQGSVSIRTSQPDGGKILITVKDTGIGIPQEHLETIFQEFAQVDTSTTRKAGGTGLGLPISRKLVELHGGRLWAESSGVDGEGSTFLIELPLEARIVEPLENLG